MSDIDERNKAILKELGRQEAEEEQLHKELERLRKEVERKQGKFSTDDKPLTAEEREEKHRLIPTRIETKTGMWEIVGEYKGDKTQVGFLAKNEHKYGPLDNCADRIVLTVEEWLSLYDELEPAFMLMVL